MLIEQHQAYNPLRRIEGGVEGWKISFHATFNPLERKARS